MASNWVAAFASHDSIGTLYINTFGVKMDPSSGDGLSAGDLASNVYTWFGAEYKACLPSRITLDSVTVRKMPEPTTDEGVHAVGSVGGAAEDANLPAELVAVLAWKTSHPGRSGRGHIEFPVPHFGTLFTSGGLFNLSAGTFATLIPALFSKLDAGHDWGPLGADGHLSHIVYSRKDNAGYDVNARLIRATPRWLERRQTAP